MSRLRIGVAVVLAVGMVSAAAGQDKQKFEVKFEKDKPFYQELTSTVDQVVKVQGGADLPLKHKQTFLFKWTPVEQDKDGKWKVKQTIEGLKMTVDIAGNPINYDSTDPNPSGSASNPALADFFKSLVGAEFTVTFNKGVVEKVDGRDEFLKKLAGANPQMETLLKKILADEALKEMTDPSAGITPPAEQAVGGMWEKKATLPLGPIGSYERTFKYTYKGKDTENKELDRVEVEPKLVYKAPTDSADGLLFRIKGGNLETINPKPGVIKFDPKTGRVAESDIGVTMKGNLDVAIGTTDTKVELFQEQKTTTKTADTSFLPAKK